MRRRASEKGKVATTWKMNDESDPIRPHFLFSLSPFPLLYPLLSHSLVQRDARGLRSCTCLLVYTRTSVLRQVRRRLKSRQPGGRRRSKGFRLVPPTRTASVVAVHPRAEAGQIKRARADNTGHRVHREARARKAERRAGKEAAPSVHASKTVSWQGNSLEDDTPASSSSWPGWKARSTARKERTGRPRCCFLIPRAAHRDMKSARRLGKVRETR